MERGTNTLSNANSYSPIILYVQHTVQYSTVRFCVAFHHKELICILCKSPPSPMFILQMCTEWKDLTFKKGKK